MIPILYTADETRFVTNGIGRLSDCTRAIVTEERNGIYELEFDYPITGAHFEEIERGRIVAVTHDDKHDIQPFVIYQRNVPDLNGIVTFNAHHISYRLNKVAVMPFTAGSVVAALQGIRENSVNANPFTFWTDKTTTANFESTVPRMARAMLGGEENSILDVFGGGEYEFDRFTVKLHAHRGQDTDVEIRYSKNLTDINETIDDSGTYNAIVPFWADSEGNVLTLPEKVLIYSGIEPQIAYLTDHNLIIIRTETDEPIEVAYTEINAVPMDLSDAFEEQPTEAQLRAAARTRFESSNAWVPSNNITVDFIALWQTEEFKEYSALQRVSLCDTVSVYYPQAGVSQVKQKVVRVVYNVLLDRYDEIELGEVSTSLGQAIRSEIMQSVPTTSMMDQAIKYATDMIRGGLGGYVVMTPGPNGYPQEILIMDTPDINTAVNVWRFNQGGLGHSSNGYEGPFDDIALTQDGRINASMITTGILNANLIRAGVLQDVNGNVTWNLATGVLNMTKGSINLGNGNFTVNDSGVIKAVEGKIGPFTITGSDFTTSDDYDYAYFGWDKIKYLTNAGYSTVDIRTGMALGFRGIEFYEGARTTAWESIPIVAEINQGRWDGNSKITLNFDIKGTTMFGLYESADDPFDVHQNSYFRKKLSVAGTKSRIASTTNYSKRELYSYETPTPIFGDIGEAMLDEEGLCYVDIDDIFTETIADKVEYQVFLQKEGQGDCWIADKSPHFFVIQGTPGLKVAWELKAKQRDYENIRLEQVGNGLDEYEHASDNDNILSEYINGMEGLLYGND